MQPKAPSQTEAAGVAHRVAAAMAGDDVGFEIAQLAWLFADSTERANKLLRSCADKLGKGMTVDAYVDFNNGWKLVESIEAVQSVEFDNWTRCCERFGWKQPEKLKVDLARLLKDSFNDVEGFKDTLLADYRKRLMAKKTVAAYPVIKFLAQRFESDASLQSEYKRLATQLVDELEADMLVACGSAKAEAAALAALEKFRAAGFPIPDRPGLISDALLLDRKTMGARLSETARLLIKAADVVADRPQDWIRLEQEYLAFVQQQESLGSDDCLEPSIREALDSLREKIVAWRSAHDTGIQLEDALQAIGERAPSAAEAERLDAIVSKAKQQDFALDEAILGRVVATLDKRPVKAMRKAKAKAKSQPTAPQPTLGAKPPPEGKSKLPLFAGAGLAAALAIGAAFLLSGDFSEESGITVQTPRSEAPAPVVRKSTTTAVEQTAPASDAAALPNSDPAADADLSAFLEELEALANDPTSVDALATWEKAIWRARDIADDVGASGDIAETIARHERALNERRAALRATLAADAERSANEAEEALLEAQRAIARSHFEDRRRIATEALNLAREAFAAAANMGVVLDDSPLRSLETRLAEARQERTAIERIQGQIASASTLPDYYRPLRQMLDVAALPQVEKATVARVVDQATMLPTELQRYLSQSASGYQFPEVPERFDPASPIVLDAEEIEFLNRLVNNRGFSEVFSSILRYHQGSDTPVSESVVYLAKEVETEEQRSGRNLSIHFTVRGFDQEGRPQYKQHKASYLQNRDGTVWGYYYTPSKLSDESKYYIDAINPRLQKLLAQPTPLEFARLLENIATQSALSDTFRLYWIQQLVALMDMAPAKWGHRLSPSIAEFEQVLAARFPEPLGPTTWRATKDDLATKDDRPSLFIDVNLGSLSQEVTAFAALLSYARSGSFVVAGHIGADGNTNIHPQARIREGLWTLNGASGSVERLDRSGRPLAFAPIVGFQPSNGSVAAAIAQASEVSGLDLQQERYLRHLPLLFSR